MASERPVIYIWRDEILDSDLPARQKLTALALSRHFDGQGNGAYPSLSTLARYCSCSRGSVRKAVDSLDSCGWIKVERRGTSRRTNVYGLRFPDGRVHAVTRGKRKEADFSEYA